MYSLKYGEREAKIIEECRKRKKPLPPHIENAPELLMGLEHFYEWYIELSTCRPGGFEVMPIPVLVINDFADDLGLDVEEREEFKFFMLSMDNAFRDWNTKEQARKKK